LSGRPITVGIDARSLVGQPTGVGRYVKNLVTHMAGVDPGVRFRLYVPTGDPPDGHLASEMEVRLRTPLLDNAVTWTHMRLPIHLMRRRVDLLHGAFYTLPAFCPAPAVVTIHDITFDMHPEWYTRRARMAFNGFAAASARKARHVLTVSECSRRDIIRAYGIPPERVTAVPLAPDPSFTPVQDPEAVDAVKRRYDLGGKYLLHVGSITPRRNIGRLLEAFAAVRRRAPGLTLALAGRAEAPSPPVEVMIHRMGLGASVRAAGYVRQDELQALYSGAAAVVYPSLYEGFGLPVVEAMACGTPAVASSTSCFPEVAGDAALLVDPESAQAIEAGIWSVLTDGSLRAKLISRGLRRAAELTWGRTARETLAVYRRALEPGVTRMAG